MWEAWLNKRAERSGRQFVGISGRYSAEVPPATGDGRERSVRFVGASSLTLSCDSLSLPFPSFYGFCFFTIDLDETLSGISAQQAGLVVSRL